MATQSGKDFWSAPWIRSSNIRLTTFAQHILDGRDPPGLPPCPSAAGAGPSGRRAVVEPARSDAIPSSVPPPSSGDDHGCYLLSEGALRALTAR